MIILEIPDVPPSPNQVGSHWIRKFALRKRWRKLVRDALYLAQALPLPETPPAYAGVKIERFGKKLLDMDNLHASMKQLLDALQDFRLIADDSSEHIHLTVLGFVHKIPHTRVTITSRIP